ncbi:hypothetical protein HYT05_04870 [Candidatus Kaiserbacteria bacterium]|nr:hypothetical protein [Candidatus Kaiserbacteria bacterium]
MESNEITDSVKEALKKRLVTPLYGVFVLSWLFFHWRFVFAAFFVSEDKIFEATGLLKDEYLQAVYFNTSDPAFYILWVFPFLFTYLIIWHFPWWVSIPAFKQDLEYRTVKRKLEIASQKELEQKKVEELVVVTERVKKEKEVKQAEKEVERIDPTSQWREEYDGFSKSIFFHKFRDILNAIYKHNGNIKVVDQWETVFEIPQDILVYSHTNDLVNLDKTTSKIELTEKGRFFVKQISQKNGYLL